MEHDLQTAVGEYVIEPSPANLMEVIREQERAAAARHTATLSAIADLRAYVERIEKEANDMMGAMNDPDAMMKMAGKFLGGMG